MNAAEMIAWAAKAVCLASAAWLVALGAVMLVTPRRALAGLAALGGTPTVHFGELAIRAAAGVALFVGAEPSKSPEVFRLVGGFLTATAVVIAIAPRRWHATFSSWWAERIPPLSVRAIGPLSMLGGAVLGWAAL